MKRILSTILLLLFTVVLTAQEGPGKNVRMKLRKIEQLEKAKLIEALNLSEDTAVRFFARRNENQEKIKSLFEERDKILAGIEDNFKSNTKNPDDYCKKTVDKLRNIDEQIINEKYSFINSLKDIFTAEQIIKYLAFEYSFRKEIRESIMRHRQR